MNFEKTITLARLNNTSMTLKIHGKYLKVQLEKLIRPKKLKRLILKVKNLLIKANYRTMQ